MSNTEFGASISEELGEELDELTEECVDLQASRSEVVEAILTACFPVAAAATDFQSVSL